MSEITQSQYVPPGADGSARLRSADRPRGAGTVARRAWRGPYVRSLVLWDAACAGAAATVGLLVRFGPPQAGVTPASPAIAAALPAVWVFAMLVARSYEDRFLWEGPEEFRRVFFAAALLLSLVATVSWGLKLEVARGFVVIALPLATALTLAQRQTQRRWLGRQRAMGRFVQTALLVGHRNGVATLQAELHRDAHHGYRVIGCCLPATGAGSQQFDGPPVLGGLDEVVDVVRRYEVDTVAVLPSPELDGAALRRLGWELEKTQADLLLAPSVSEVAGPWVRIRPGCGLSLLQMERPELHGVRAIIKASFDRTCAVLLLVLMAPVLVAAAVAVKTSSPGPVFFRQERVGRDGRTFGMLKFRSMQVGRRGAAARAGAVERRQRCAVQAAAGPPGHPRRRRPAAVLTGRAAAAGQRRQGRDVAGRTAPTAAVRGRALRRRDEPPAGGQAGADRAVAGQRPVGPVLGRLGAPRPAVRRQLVAAAGRDDPLADGGGPFSGATARIELPRCVGPGTGVGPAHRGVRRTR
jgi:hypothetical protein